MLGAIIGDVVGSRFEFDESRNRGKNFEFFTGACRLTDDSYMTAAVARALMECNGRYENLKSITIRDMVKSRRCIREPVGVRGLRNGCLTIRIISRTTVSATEPA